MTDERFKIDYATPRWRLTLISVHRMLLFARGDAPAEVQVDLLDAVTSIEAALGCRPATTPTTDPASGRTPRNAEPR